MSTIVLTHTFPSGQMVAVCQGDLTAETTDAIVNAANEHLRHGGGVAGAIVRRGGASIQAESDAWLRQHGSVQTGQVAVTGAGNLACKYVIHAVGPVWHGGTQNEDTHLDSAVTNSLRQAAELQLQSIALPAISSGIFGFPKERCAALIVAAVERFCSEQPQSSLRTIKLTNIDDETVTVMRAAVERLQT